jgi:hypothetical protein
VNWYERIGNGQMDRTLRQKFFLVCMVVLLSIVAIVLLNGCFIINHVLAGFTCS